jgi:hypothetical protein
VVATHDGQRITSLVALSGTNSPSNESDVAACLAACFGGILASNTAPATTTWATGGVIARAFLAS